MDITFTEECVVLPGAYTNKFTNYKLSDVSSLA